MLCQQVSFLLYSETSGTCPPPKDHNTHLRRTKQALNQARVKPNILLIHIPHPLYHEVDIREDGEEGDRRHAYRKAQEKDLGFG